MLSARKHVALTFEAMSRLCALLLFCCVVSLSFALPGTANPETCNVLVVGAGVSGLGSAERLHEAGYSVIVLEAKDRIGGRIWTNRSAGLEAFDTGASWIHGISGNPIYKRAEDLSLKMVPTDYDSGATYGSDGPLDAGSEREWEAFSERLTVGMHESVLQDNDESVKDVLDRTDRGSLTAEEAFFVAHINIEQEYAAPLKELSVAALLEGADVEGGDVMIVGGYDQVAADMATALDVRLSHPVARIDYSDAPVVTTEEGDEFVAKAVVVTVPLGVLKDDAIDFVPKLPAAKQDAIEALGMGLMNKVFLRFPYKFWEGEEWIYHFKPEGPDQSSLWADLTAVVGEPVLLAFQVGDYALEVEGMSDEEVVSLGMESMRAVFGNGIPEPISTGITRWASDEFMRGSYSFLKVGSYPFMRREIAAPVDGKLYFAGEATHSGFPATVHGAYMSGRREAARIMSAVEGA